MRTLFVALTGSAVALAFAGVARRYAVADRLRTEIAAAGWEVRDVAGGFQLVRL